MKTEIHEINAIGVTYTRNSGRHYAMPSSGIVTISEGETIIVYNVGTVHTMYTVDDGLVESQDYRVGQKV